MKVLDTRVLIKPKKREEVVEKIGNLEFPVGSGEYSIGEVVAVGDKVGGDLKVGETVYYYPNAGKSINIEGQTYRVVSSVEIIVVL